MLSEIFRASDGNAASRTAINANVKEGGNKVWAKDFFGAVSKDSASVSHPQRQSISQMTVTPKKKVTMTQLSADAVPFGPFAASNISSKSNNGTDVRDELKQLRQLSSQKVATQKVASSSNSTAISGTDTFLPPKMRMSKVAEWFKSSLFDHSLRLSDAYIFLLKLTHRYTGPISIYERGGVVITSSSDANLLLAKLVNYISPFINSAGHYLRSKILSNEHIQHDALVSVSTILDYHREHDSDDSLKTNKAWMTNGMSNGSSTLFNLSVEDNRHDSIGKEAKALLNERSNVANEFSNLLRNSTSNTTTNDHDLRNKASKAIPQLTANYEWFASLFVRCYLEIARQKHHGQLQLPVFIKLLAFGRISIELYSTLMQAVYNHLFSLLSSSTTNASSSSSSIGNSKEPSLWQLDLLQPAEAYSLRVASLHALGGLIGELLFLFPPTQRSQSAPGSNKVMQLSLVHISQQATATQNLSLFLPALLEIVRKAANHYPADHIISRLGGNALVESLQRISSMREFTLQESRIDIETGVVEYTREMVVISSNRFFALLCLQEIMALLNLPLSPPSAAANGENSAANGRSSSGSSRGGVDGHNWAMTAEFMQLNLPSLLHTTASTATSTAAAASTVAASPSLAHSFIAVPFNNHGSSSSYKDSSYVGNHHDQQRSSVPSSPALSCDTNNTRTSINSNLTIRQKSKGKISNYPIIRTQSSSSTSKAQPQPLSFSQGPSPSKASPSKAQRERSYSSSVPSVHVGIEDQLAFAFWERQHSLRVVHDFLLSNFTDAAFARTRSVIEDSLRQFSLACTSPVFINELLIVATAGDSNALSVTVEQQLQAKAQVHADLLLEQLPLLTALQQAVDKQLTAPFDLHQHSLPPRVLSLAIWLTRKDLALCSTAMQENLKEYGQRKLLEAAVYLVKVVMKMLNAAKQLAASAAVVNADTVETEAVKAVVKSQLNVSSSLTAEVTIERRQQILSEIDTLLMKLQTKGIIVAAPINTFSMCTVCCSINSNDQSNKQMLVCCFGSCQDNSSSGNSTRALNHFAMATQTLLQIMQLLIQIFSSSTSSTSGITVVNDDQQHVSTQAVSTLIDLGLATAESVHAHMNYTVGTTAIMQHKIKGELGKFLISSLPLLLLLDELCGAEGLTPSVIIIRMLQLDLLTQEAVNRALTVLSRDRVGSYYCHCVGVDDARVILQRQIGLFKARHDSIVSVSSS